MDRSVRVALVIACSCAASSAYAAQTVTYSYDALGRLTGSQILGGPGTGVTQNYQYDAAGNRLNESAAAPGQTAVSLSMPSTTALVTSAGITLTVNVSGATPGGTVTFTENGAFLGIAYVSGGQATITFEGLPQGTHSIRATYSGDGSYAPKVDTFSIKVRDIRWLPAILELLLAD